MTTPAEIARSLSEGAHILLSGGYGQIKHAVELVQAGLAVDSIEDDGTFQFTPLGLQVRQILQEQNNADV